MKTCSMCGELKSLTDFVKDNRNKTDGRRYRCRDCDKICRTKLKIKKWEKRPKERMEEGMRTCSFCKKDFPLSPEYFHRNNTKPGGFGYGCKECKKVYNQKWRNKNKDTILIRNQTYYEKCRSKIIATNQYNPLEMFELLQKDLVYIDDDGYYRFTDSSIGRYTNQPVHRWVMEKHLGRPLIKDKEFVHHSIDINGHSIKDDNRLHQLSLTEYEVHGEYHRHIWGKKIET